MNKERETEGEGEREKERGGKEERKEDKSKLNTERSDSIFILQTIKLRFREPSFLPNIK